MADYLSREEILRVFDNLTVKNPDDKYQHGMQDAIDCLIPEVINGMESADVQPVKHGRWIEDHDLIECSVCGFEVKDEYYEKRDMTSTETSYVFCPNCGARMDGEKNG